MDFRINTIVIFLLLTVDLVLCSTLKQSGSSRSFKKKGSRAKLSDNIGENPFLQEHFTTTTAPLAFYQGNPFLTNTPKPQVHGNGNEDHDTLSNTGPQHAEEHQVVNVAVYIQNPFLQSGINGLARNPSNTEYINTPLTNGNQESNVVKQPPVSGTPYILPNIDTSTKTKSDIKCEEYARQVAATTEVLSLVGTNSAVQKVSFDNCRTVNRLVIGGTMASVGEYPHMVALGRGTEGVFSFQCGGTLIAPEWVLTAAHCTYGPSGSPTVVRVGLNDLSETQSGITVNIKTTMRHPSYKPPAMYADIALIKLDFAITFNNNIRPACLYQLYDSVPSQAWVTGWGVTEFGGDKSDKLQKALLEVVDNLACTIRHNRSIAVPYGVSPSMICAGDPHGGWTKDTCQGDSGGPLQVIHPGNGCLYQVIGVTSFGQGCAIIDTPGVYTRVSHYLNWIEDNVWPDT